MDEKKTIKDVLQETFEKVEADNVRLGMGIAEIKSKYFYSDLIAYLKGDDEKCGHMYFHELKPLYDQYGYEKVNRILLALEEAKDGQENE